MLAESLPKKSASKDKKYRAHDTEHRKEIIYRDLLFQNKDRNWNKYCQCNRLLHDLELRNGHDCIAYAVGGDLQKVFKQSNAPAYQGSDDPGFR